MTRTTTSYPVETCTECGRQIVRHFRSRTYDLIAHMVNYGEITVGEARDELRRGMMARLDADVADLLAGWVLDHEGDDEYRAVPA